MKSIKRYSGKSNPSKNINIFYVILGIGVLLAGLYFVLGKRLFGIKEGAEEGGDAAEEGGDAAEEGGDAAEEGGDAAEEGGDAAEEGGVGEEGGAAAEEVGAAAKGGKAISNTVLNDTSKTKKVNISGSHLNSVDTKFSPLQIPPEGGLSAGETLFAAQNELKMLQNERLRTVESDLQAKLSSIQENTNKILARQLTNPTSKKIVRTYPIASTV